MVSNFLGGYLACVLHVRNNYFFILLLRRLTALGKGLLYYKQLNIGFYSLFNFWKHYYWPINKTYEGWYTYKKRT